MNRILLAALLVASAVPAAAQVDDDPSVGDFASAIAPARALATPPGQFAQLAAKADAFLSGTSPSPHRAITAAQVKAYIDDAAERCGAPLTILDIRVPARFAGLPGSGSDGHLAARPEAPCAANVKALNVVFETVAKPDNLVLLPTDGSRVVIVCNSGHTASEVVSILAMLGYDNVWVLRGGFAAWAPRTSFPVYQQ